MSAQLLMLFAVTIFLLSCSQGLSEYREATVVYASGADLQSINPLVTVHPLAKAVQKHVLFLTLAVYDSLLRPTPRLAEWKWSEDRTSLSFSLRPDVRWHDGTRTSAYDVEMTLDMARNSGVAYPRSRDLAAITNVNVSDSLNLTVDFVRPQPVFPDVLTDLAILPAHILSGVQPESVRIHTFNRTPVGNGPFEFVEYRPNQRWVFERFDGFPTDLGGPEFERFVVVVVDEPATKLAALTSGELDFAGISPAHAEFVHDDKTLYTIEYPLHFVYALVWNMRRQPFDDLRVRRALTMALDRQLLIEAYVYGYGRIAAGPVPPEHPWHVDLEPVPYDPERAASLLEEAGWRVGEDGVRVGETGRLAIDLLTVGSGDVPLEQMIQAQLCEVGVEVRIRQHELTTFLALAQARDREFDALVTGIPGDLSLSYVAAMFGGREPGPLAYPGYRNTQFDELLDATDRAQTQDELKHAWNEALRVLHEDLPTTWLYHARGLQGANKRVENADIDFRGELARIASWRVRRSR